MLTRFIILLSCSIFANGAYADNCNFNKLKFGVSQVQLKSIFKLDALDVATAGEATIVSGATEVCKELPETAIVEFAMIDNNFIQMRIINKNTTGELFNYATKIFGDRDNKPKDLKKIKTTDKVKLGLWAKDDSYRVIYTTYKTDKNEFEKLTITSNKHHALFDSANIIKTQAADNYLKENKLGKYHPNYSDVETNNDSNKKSNIKDNYSESGIHKDKNINENENDRGFNYK